MKILSSREIEDLVGSHLGKLVCDTPIYVGACYTRDRAGGRTMQHMINGARQYHSSKSIPVSHSLRCSLMGPIQPLSTHTSRSPYSQPTPMVHEMDLNKS